MLPLRDLSPWTNVVRLDHSYNAVRVGVLCGLMLVVVAGCNRSPVETSAVADADSAEIEPEPVPAPTLDFPAEVTIFESELWTSQPAVANAGQIPGGVSFAAVGDLPEGLTLEPTTGELKWQPTELQGPGTYAVQLATFSNQDAEIRSEQTLTIHVAEQNQPPEIAVPNPPQAEVGKLLEAPFELRDNDFPSQTLTVRMEGTAPSGLKLDPLRKMIYWEVPLDFDQPEVRIRLVAEDGGEKPQRTALPVLIQVNGIRPPQTEEEFRRADAYLALPDLPRPDAPGDVAHLPLTGLDEKLSMVTSAPRLSLIVPDEVKDRINIRYANGRLDHFYITVTEPFERIGGESLWPDGTIAECEWGASQIVWNWALTRELDVRNLQNNVRDCVIAAEYPETDVELLIALTTPIEIPAISLDAVLTSEDAAALIARQPRTAVPLGMHSEQGELTAVRGPLEELHGTLDHTWLMLSSPRLQQRLQLRQLAFKIVPTIDQIRLELVSEPSLADARSQLDASRRILRVAQTSFNKWSRKLGGFRAAYNRASRLPARSGAELTLKQTQLSLASQGIQRSEAKLAELRREIPLAQALVVNRERELQTVLQQFEPLRQYEFRGSFYRRVGDVRVTVLRIGLPPLEPAEDVG